MGKEVKIDFSIYAGYIVLGIVAGYLLKSILEIEINIFLLALIIIPSFYTIEYFFIKKLFSDWWQKSFLHTGLTCGCDSYKKWRNNNSIYITRIITLIPVFGLTTLILPYLSTPKGVKKITIDQEFKLNFKKLELELRTRKTTEFYEIEKILRNELVENGKGSYYIVNIDNPKYKEKVLFEEGKYVIKDFDNRLITPLNKFMDEVYYYLDAGTECQLYIKGSADIKGNKKFKAKMNNEYDFDKIEYFPKISLSNYDVQRLGDYYTNSDLPNLRAKYIQ